MGFFEDFEKAESKVQTKVRTGKIKIQPQQSGSILTDLYYMPGRMADIAGESIGQSMQFLRIPGGKYVEELYHERRQRPGVKGPEYEGTVLDDPKRLYNPRWWVNLIGDQLPNFAMMALPGMAAYRGAKLLGMGFKAASKWAGATSAAAAFGLEGGNAYTGAKEEMLQMGYDEDTADKIATLEGGIVGTVNMLLEKTPLTILLKNPGSKNMMIRIIRQALWEGGTEVVQESVQTIAARLGHDSKITKDKIGHIIEAGLGGFGMGGGVATVAGGEGTTSKTKKKTETVEDEQGEVEVRDVDEGKVEQPDAIDEHIQEEIDLQKLSRSAEARKEFFEKKAEEDKDKLFPIDDEKLFPPEKTIKDAIDAGEKLTQGVIDKKDIHELKASKQELKKIIEQSDDMDQVGQAVEFIKQIDKRIKKLDKKTPAKKPTESGQKDKHIPPTDKQVGKETKPEKKKAAPKIGRKHLGKVAAQLEDGTIVKGDQVDLPGDIADATPEQLKAIDDSRKKLKKKLKGKKFTLGRVGARGKFASEEDIKNQQFGKDKQDVVDKLGRGKSRQFLTDEKERERKSQEAPIPELSKEQWDVVNKRSKSLRGQVQSMVRDPGMVDDVFDYAQMELIKFVAKGGKKFRAQEVILKGIADVKKDLGMSRTEVQEKGPIPKIHTTTTGARDQIELPSTPDEIANIKLTPVEQIRKDLTGSAVPEGIVYSKLSPRERKIKQQERLEQIEQLQKTEPLPTGQMVPSSYLHGKPPSPSLGVLGGGIQEETLKKKAERVVYQGTKKGKGYKTKGTAKAALKRLRIKDPDKYNNARVVEIGGQEGHFIEYIEQGPTKDRIVPDDLTQEQKKKLKRTGALELSPAEKQARIEKETRKKLDRDPTETELVKAAKSKEKVTATSIATKQRTKKQKNKIDTTIRNIINDEVGSADAFIGARKILDLTRNIYDLVDVEAPWVRLGAQNTAKAMKNFFGVKTRHQIDGAQESQNLVKELKKSIPNPTQKDWNDVVLAYEDDRYLKTLSKDQQNKIKPAMDLFGRFLKEAEDTLKNRGVDFNWKERLAQDLTIKATEAETVAEQQKYIDMLEDLKHTTYVHIPIRVLFAKTLQDFANVRGNKSKRAEVQALLSMLTPKKREVVSLNSILDKATGKRKELLLSKIDPVSIMIGYQTKFSKDMALLDIRDALRQDGFLKFAGERRKRGIKWQKAGRGYGVLQGSYVDRRALDMISNLLSVTEKQNIYDKSMSLIKMSAFYNPFFLPAYDAYQSLMSGAALIGGIRNVPKNLVLAGRLVMSNDIRYKEAMQLGLFSKPFDFPFKTYLQNIENIKNHGELGGVKGWAAENFGEFKRKTFNIKEGSIIGAMYNASWNSAWKMDEMIRMFTYLQLQKKNKMGKAEAAQLAASFHGDYASVPPKTRRMLNRFLFTPTFKIVMGKLYGRMLVNILKVPIKFATGKGKDLTATQKQYAMGAVGVFALNAAFDQLMKGFGFEPEDDEWWNFGRRYVRTEWTEDGPSELVFTWSNPGNMFQRYAQRAAKAKKYHSESGWAKSAMTVVGYDLHPLFRTFMRLSENRRYDGTKIWYSNDSALKQGMDQFRFGLNELIKITETTNTALDKLGVGPDLKSRSEILLKNKKVLNSTLDAIFLGPFAVANAYIRSDKQRRAIGRIRSMQRDHLRDQKEYVRQHGTLNEKWLKNHLKRLEKEMNEIE